MPEISVTAPDGSPSAMKKQVPMNDAMRGVDLDLEKDPEEGKLTFMEAVGMNIMNMFGTGPLITIPYCVASVDPMGPHAIWGYGVACIACICDSFVWSEIGSMWPESGGPYVYLRNLYGPKRWGRLVSFIFVWQFFISGPAEAASAFIAIAEYLTYFSESTATYGYRVLISYILIAFCFFLLARKLTDIGKAGLVMAGITVVAMIYTIIAGFSHFDTANLATPPGAFSSTSNGIWILALASRFGVYDMTGYYDVCFMGGEVKNPRRTIPLSCISTCSVVAVIYLLCYVAVIGSMPWEGYIHMYTDEYEGTPPGIMALFTEWRFGSTAFAGFITIIVAITIFGSVFSMLVGFVFVPPAAARDGYFYSFFAPSEDKKGDGLPWVSLLFIIGLTMFFSLFSMGIVIEAMCTMIVLVMFCGQSLGLIIYRYTTPEDEQEYGWRMPWFPLPAIIQFVLFFFIFITSETGGHEGSQPVLEMSVGFIAVGFVMFMLRSKYNSTWPFNKEDLDDEDLESEHNIEKVIATSPSSRLTVSPTAYIVQMEDIMMQDSRNVSPVSTPTGRTPQRKVEQPRRHGNNLKVPAREIR